MRPSLAVLAAILALAACGEVPQPFRHDDSIPRLAVPKMTRGVTVRPPADTADGRALAESLVRAFEDQEVPALVGDGHPFGYVVEGELQETAQGAQVLWTLKAPDGTVSETAEHRVPRATLEQGSPILLKRAAMAAASRLSMPLADPDAAPSQMPTPQAIDRRPTATVAPLRGLPGDGDSSLTEAMKRALGRGGLAIKPEGGTYLVEGRVTVTPGRQGEEIVGVAWIVKTGKDGAELGRVAQDGSIPKGRLDKSWGTMARDIAEGGAAGVVEVVLTDSENHGGKQP
ncbi:hypothetical protein [Magnetospirillum aberrantis]|uniref:Uncharacterized protein n=1 Tax=Magnetospirillum aberrantis SpK TaxID=908842 RepID=A0A7C9QW25_9PROT|nr:hypothetical protein [Magnetospirillum aberrantis]NFV82018.1 hypothetical protein [Magnetospirillum aberrantis SpK]